MNPASPQDELRTIRDYIRWGTSRLNQGGVFSGHGMDRSLDEAAYLVAHAVALAPRVPENLLDAGLTGEERDRVVELIERRVTSRKPAAYLTGEAWFAGFRFQVDERVLVPRSPLAELVEGGFLPWCNSSEPRILDLGTGSGCIAVACALLMDARVDAVDISEDALEVAAANVAEYALEQTVELIHSDLFARLGDRHYDLIVSNPPYVGAEEMAMLPEEYRHEPSIGLRSGHDGLDVPLRILLEARRHLKPDGTLFMEVGASARALDRTLRDAGFEWLNFEWGGDGVLAIGYDQLKAINPQVKALVAARENDGQ